MARLLALILVAGLLVAGANAEQPPAQGKKPETAVQVSGVTSTQVSGSTVVTKAPGTSVVAVPSGTNVVTPGAAVQVANTTSGKPVTTVQTVAGVNVRDGPQGTVVSGIPYVGTVVAGRSESSTQQAPTQGKPTKAGTESATQQAPVQGKPTKGGAASTTQQAPVQGKPTKGGAESSAAAANTAVPVKKPETAVKVSGVTSTQVSGSTVATKAPGTSVVAGPSGTDVVTPGAAVQVANTTSGKPVTTVQTVAGVNVRDGPQGTVVSGIPFVGTVVAPGRNRRMLRA